MNLSRRIFLRRAAIASLAGLAAACTPQAVETGMPPTVEPTQALVLPSDTPLPASTATTAPSPTATSIPVLEPSRQVLKGVTKVEEIARLIGDGAINDTPGHWKISGADLGSMFDKDGKLYMVFGDSFGCCIPGTGGPGNATDWRYNCMAVITDRDPSDGLTFDDMLTDKPGHAKQLLTRGKFDKTIIPTYGVAVGNRMILHYMAVLAWGEPGEWVLNESGLAYSDDDGQTWVKDSNAKWDGKSNFGQAAFVKHENDLYTFGIPGGRFGGVKLARVAQESALDLSAYRYFAESSAQEAQWVENEASAALIVPAPVGEFSVIWNEYLGRWLMAYLDSMAGGLVLREAEQLWGPWGPSIPLVSGSAYPGLYGSYMHPWYVENNGESIYFSMSRWNTYAVYLMKARLDRAG